MHHSMVYCVLNSGFSLPIFFLRVLLTVTPVALATHYHVVCHKILYFLLSQQLNRANSVKVPPWASDLGHEVQYIFLQGSGP